MKTARTARKGGRPAQPRAGKSRKVTGAVIAWWVAILTVVCCVSVAKQWAYSPVGADLAGDVASSPTGRKLLSASDWNPVHTVPNYVGPLGWPGIFLWIPMTVWIFSGVAIAADTYFQPALEGISDALELSADVRGATFLAAASSAPEFFTSFADTFLVSDEGGEGFGVGAIVGSAVFNILIIVALSTIPTLKAGSELEKNKPSEPERAPDTSDAAYKKAQKNYQQRMINWNNKKKKLEEEGSYLPVDWYPLTRDSFFYSASIVILVATVATNVPDKRDRKPHVSEGCVNWYESLIYILLYAAYILFMYHSANLRSFCEDKKARLFDVFGYVGTGDHRQKAPTQGVATGPLDVETAAAELKAKEELEETAGMDEEDDDDDDDEEVSGLFTSIVEFEDEWSDPLGCVCNVAGIVTIPFKLLFTLTIPNVGRPAMESHFVLSFAMCILWIAFLSAMMVKIVSWIGAIITLHPVVMGLVVLAAGTSVPDALGSYNEAKHGNADAAVSNALGSNVFDICVGLGVPWFIFSLVKKRCFAIPAEEIMIPTIILFLVLALFLGTLVYFKMRLYGKVGLVYLVIYVIFVAWVLINGLVIKAKL
ncbi:putative sodium/potassium/calcium exchanger [Diplonema papillatum]|nr:putative sodium/potassium/calcium exchanger [Diplonema papillatum]